MKANKPVTTMDLEDDAAGNNRTVQGTPAGTPSHDSTPDHAPGNNRSIHGTPGADAEINPGEGDGK
jgi:hypothetical protein